MLDPFMMEPFGSIIRSVFDSVSTTMPLTERFRFGVNDEEKHRDREK
jgi:hypothetical protein